MSLPIAIRAMLRYVAAWSPLVVLFILILTGSGDYSAQQVVSFALSTVSIAAVLGLPVVAIASRGGWPTQLTAGFVVAHVGLAAAYSAIWVLGIMLTIMPGAGSFSAALASAESWIAYQTAMGIIVYFTVAGITWARLGVATAREQAARTTQAEALRVQAELAALRGQLDPHFLFNTLHSVSVLVRRDPQLAETALERLASLLRYVLDHKRGLREDVLLSDELAFVDNYLAIEAIRFGERLRIERDVSEDALACSVPSFALQPLVENAIKHAIAPRAQGGTLSLHGHREGDVLVLEVRDDGPGQSVPSAASAAALAAASSASRSSDTSAGAAPRSFGIGLDALRQRLQALYGGAASLTVASAPGAGFAVSMRLPA